jgi:hypothetical protein
MAPARTEGLTNRTTLARQLTGSASTAAQLQRSKQPIGQWLLLLSAAFAALLAFKGTAEAARALTAGAAQPFLTLSTLGLDSNTSVQPAQQTAYHSNGSRHLTQQAGSLINASTADNMNQSVIAMDRQDYAEAIESRAASGT